MNKQAFLHPLAPVECKTAGSEIRIPVTNEGFYRPPAQARLCDTLTFTNQGKHSVWMAFGPHDQHITYPGMKERPLKHGQSLSFVLVSAGEYEYHDHFNHEHEGTIAIIP